MLNTIAITVLLLLVVASLPINCTAGEKVVVNKIAWPSVTREMRPWTRWWWHGSAVDEANIKLLLETYHAAGLGGVEITPIYGVQGEELREIPYLSTRWIEILKYSILEAKRLDIGVDMPTGTGWPFGGQNVTEEDAQDKYSIRTTPLIANSLYTEDFKKQLPQALSAYSDDGRIIILLDKIAPDGVLRWTPPPGKWTLYSVSVRSSKMHVKRAAPSGEGLCINPFSQESVIKYLKGFDSALSGLPAGALRCEFHDSFEYQSDWSPRFFEEFKLRRGYDLGLHLTALAKLGDPDEIARVRTDCRETISDLLLKNFTQTWTEWAHKHGSLSRIQAHGSPENLLDLYGEVDIPETEIFHLQGDPRVSKFASSAAHVMGRPLASSESATWLGEHYTVSLAQVKTALDKLLLSGINHIFYHGTCYSPADAQWPGWLFYASEHFEPTNPTWRDFPVLNSYVTRCQSILQTGKPSNDVLLYWPLHDLWQKTNFFGLTIEGKWLTEQPIGLTAQTLLDHGFGYDYISDHQLALSKVDKGEIELPGGRYKTIVVPPCDFMPLSTLQRLIGMARAGAIVIFQGGIPSDVPGAGDLAHRRKQLVELTASIKFSESQDSTVREAKIGVGRVLVGNDLEKLLSQARILRETMRDQNGIQFIKRRDTGGFHYFIVNQGGKALNGWVKLAISANSVLIMDPMTRKVGIAKTRRTGSQETSIYLQLKPGASTILSTFTTKGSTGPLWPYQESSGKPVELAGNWKVRFLEGGPALPQPYETTKLESWTRQPDIEAARFGGTARYTLSFNAPTDTDFDWLLDLGEVHESARIRLNGEEIVTLISPPFQMLLPRFKKTGNVLEIDVTNLAANRIRDLDRRKVRWKIFKEINFVNLNYKPFDASDWPVRDSGLIGPVRLIPMKQLSFNEKQ